MAGGKTNFLDLENNCNLRELISQYKIAETEKENEKVKYTTDTSDDSDNESQSHYSKVLQDPSSTCKSKLNGFQIFFKDVSKVIGESSKSVNLGAMSKVASLAWRKLENEERQEWNKKARENPVKENVCKCGKIFKREKDVKFHSKRCRDSACKECGKVFKDAILLQKHVKVHFPDTTNTCTVCNKVFCSKQALRRHEVVHPGV